MLCSTSFRKALVLLLAFASHLVPLFAADTPAVSRLTLPERKPLTLKHVGKLNRTGAGIECSGLVRSRQHDDLFWSINDSGNPPRIYPLRRHGEDFPPAAGESSPGVLVEGVQNVDWEDLTLDADGRLIVADVGNNLNQRQDLTLYVFAEPSPTVARVTPAQRLVVRFPDQTQFPPPKENLNFDCEALFTVGNTIHLLSKHRSDTLTKLYRLDHPQPDQPNVLTLVDRFDPLGMVTAANATRDGKRLAVITYQSVWLFERDTLDQPFFSARIRWAPFVSAQMESVCFADDQTLLLADELLGQLYEVSVNDLTQVR
jgi:hypothetical protein